jgi:O-antigen/teichoic acid export membrane protein
MGVIARQSIKGAMANYLGVAIGFVTTFFVLTRMLTTEEVGLTRVMVDAAVLFSAIAQLGTNASIVRFFPWFKDGRHRYGFFGLALLLPLAGFALVGLALLAFRGRLVEVYSVNSPLLTDYFGLLPMLIFFSLYLTVFETCASVLMRITVPKMVREVGIRVFTLAAYLLYGYRVITLDAFVWLFCGSYGLAMLLNLVYLLRIEHFRLGIFRVDWRHLRSTGLARDMVRYTLFMTATVLAGNVPLLGSLFLGAKAGLALTGVYTIAFFIANVVEVPYRSLGAISRPVIAAAVKEGDWEEVNRLGRQVSLHQLMVSLMIFYVIWINLDTLFALIPNGEDYRGGAGVVLILGLAKVLNSSLSISTDVLNYSRHYAYGLLFIGVLTASALVLNDRLIGPMSINGAAMATLLSYAIYFALLLAFLWRRLRVSLFSGAQLKTLAVMAAAFALDWGWRSWLTPLVATGGMAPMLADAVLKTAVLASAAAAAMVAWKVSPTVNDIVARFLHKNHR